MQNTESEIEEILLENGRLKSHNKALQSLFNAMKLLANMADQTASDFRRASIHAYIAELKATDCGGDRYLTEQNRAMIKHAEKWAKEYE